MSRTFPKRPRNAIVAMQLRIPEYLRRQLAASAAANMRSLNAECMTRLMQSLADMQTAKDDLESARMLARHEHFAKIKAAVGDRLKRSS